jgi:hypothetical protein
MNLKQTIRKITKASQIRNLQIRQIQMREQTNNGIQRIDFNSELGEIRASGKSSFKSDKRLEI